MEGVSDHCDLRNNRCKTNTRSQRLHDPVTNARPHTYSLARCSLICHRGYCGLDVLPPAWRTQKKASQSKLEWGFFDVCVCFPETTGACVCGYICCFVQTDVIWEKRNVTAASLTPLLPTVCTSVTCVSLLRLIKANLSFLLPNLALLQSYRYWSQSISIITNHKDFSDRTCKRL